MLLGLAALPDGCGGAVDCGACPAGQTCNSSKGVCECIAKNPCASRACGPAVDSCGKAVSCGACPAGQTCSAPTGICDCIPQNACVGKACGPAVDNCGNAVSCGACTPSTTAQACGASTCGSAPDDCGDAVTCGTCPAGTSCSGSPGTCPGPCIPETRAHACGAGACGSAPDGCGGSAACGACPSGEVCGGDSQCRPIGSDPCGIGSNTQACLSARGATCFSCAQSNGCFDPAQLGGTCEETSGTSARFAGALPDGKTCSQVLASSTETETQVCLQTLGSIFLSRCSSTLQETPCLCGATDAAACLGGSATPTGLLYDLYACAFDTTSSTQLQSDFTNQSFGAGQANALVQCVAAFDCACFGQ